MLSGFQLYYEDGSHGVSLSIDFPSHRLLSEAETKQRSLIMGQSVDRFGRFSMAEASDQDGRFRITKVIPDVNFDLWVKQVKVARTMVKAGERKDLGDIVVK